MTAHNRLKTNKDVRVPKIDSARLKALLDGVNSFGRNPATGGFNRIGYSEADMAVRSWFVDEMRNTGLAVSRDGIGNLFGKFGSDNEPCVMIGSHLDTVPEGGAYDGALGVCVALECVRSLIASGVEPARPVVVVATAEEEGRFGGMLGSQAITGKVDRHWLENATDANGIALADAMRDQGLDPMSALECAWPNGSVSHFLELHIEQGPVLENRKIPVGIADSVSGVCNLQLTFTGTANHSGTTPMGMRADAFAGLSALACALDGILSGTGSPNSRMTIGKVTIEPNFPHTIPGLASCIVNIRDTDKTVQRSLADAVKSHARECATAKHLGIEMEETSWLDPVTLDSGLVHMLQREAETLGLENMIMLSGAGHDAQTMSALCPSGLIFVPSRNGISHSPEEFTEWADIEKGAQLMLNAVMRLIST